MIKLFRKFWKGLNAGTVGSRIRKCIALAVFPTTLYGLYCVSPLIVVAFGILASAVTLFMLGLSGWVELVDDIKYGDFYDD